MGWELHAGTEGLAHVAEAWTALEDRVDCQPFQTHSFARLWQQHVGERIGARPLVVTHAENGVVRAIFPACIVPRRPVRLLTWLSAPDLQDYGDIVRDPAATLPADQFVSGALALLRRETRGCFVYLTNVRGDAVAYPALAGQMRPLKVTEAPYVSVDGGFDEYVGSLPRDKRRHIQRSWRRLAETGEVALELLGPADPRLRDVLDWLFDTRLARFERLGEHDVLLDPGTLEFRRAQACEQPDTRVACLTLDNELLAAEIVTVRGGRLCALVPGFDEARSHLSPGRMLHYLLLRECFERGLDTFDLCWGGQRHKFLFTDTSEPMTTFVSKGASGALLSAALRVKRSLETRPTAK